MSKKVFLFSIVCLSVNCAVAQRQVYPQSLYWLRYQIRIDLSDKMHWTNEVDSRRFFKPDIQNQLIFHSVLHFKRSSWDFAGGLSVSNAYASRPENGYKNVTTEIRPLAEIAHEISNRNISILNRLRIDNRFFEVNENESIWDNSRYVARFRYRLQLKITLANHDSKNPISVRLANEIMVNTKENVFDQNRFYITGDFYINKNFSLETGYIYIYQQRFAATEFFSRHVFRFSILHKMSMVKN